MKTMIVTTPIRPKPTPFPPFGSLALIKYLRKAGLENVVFYDIDCLRPSFDQALEHIVRERPDVLGISAVVSTAYAYTKRLSEAVKARLPDTLVVVGGNMAASAEILLRKTGTDLCVIGEGEVVFANLAKRAAQTRRPEDFKDIAGLALIDPAGQMINTGYETQIPGPEIYDIDWDDLARGSNIEHFFPTATKDAVITDEVFNGDPRIREPHRQGKRFGYLYASKGCVNRCTFCHRWDKGLRVIPVDLLMQRLEELIERFNVGFVKFADENFGADPRWLKEFCEKIRRYDVLWHCGTRVRGMTPEVVAMMKDAGCARLGFGIETGSEKMLMVMEKKVGVAENYRAVETTQALAIAAPIALVIGMPGETKETIRETITFCQHAKTLAPTLNPNDLSINYAQALPGTPLYEFARAKGFIGRDIDGEEQYLISISDKDAHDEFSTLNFTEESTLACQTWRPLLTIETNYAFIRKWGIETYLRNLLTDRNFFSMDDATDTGYFANPRRLLETKSSASSGAPSDQPSGVLPRRPSLLRLLRKRQLGLALICYPVLAYRLRHFLIGLVLIKDAQKFGVPYALSLLADHLKLRLSKLMAASRRFEYKSLRKIVDKDIGPLMGDAEATLQLRKGR